MFMTKLRGTKKDNRIWWIVVVVVLGFGLVGSYAVWTGGNIPTTNNTQQTTKADAKTQAQNSINDFKNSIKQVEERLKVAKDKTEIGSLNVALGNYHYDIGQTYMFTLNQEKEGIVEFKAATDAYTEAVKYDDKNADLRVDFATAAMYSAQNDLAKEQFEAALKIDPKHLNGHFNYAIFLANGLQDYTNAMNELKTAQEIAKASGDKAYQDRIAQVITAVEAASKAPAKTTTQSTYGK